MSGVTIDSPPSLAWVRVAPGVEVRPLIGGEGAALVLYRLAAGVTYPLHRHAHPEYGTVIQGRGELLLEGESRALKEGDSYYIPSDVPHGASLPEQPTPMVILHVVVGDPEQVDGPVLEVALREARRLPLNTSDPPPTPITSARPAGD